MGRAARSKSKNWINVFANSKTNSMLNKEEQLMPPRTKRNLKENSRKSSMPVKKTRRTLSVFKTSSTNSKSRSRPTRDKPKKLKNKVTPTWPNSERSNTNLTNLKNVLIWLKPPLTRPDQRPENKSFEKIFNQSIRNR